MQNIEEQLSNCDREPIQIIGGIQPHGCFLAFHQITGKIFHSSSNALEFFNLPTQKIVGRRLADLFSEERAKEILDKTSQFADLPTYITLEKFSGGQSYEVLMYEI